MFLIDIRDPPIVNHTPLDSSRQDDSVGMIGLATKSILRLRGFDENSQKGGKRTFGGAYTQTYMVVIILVHYHYEK
jgi:hypothetical protein